MKPLAALLFALAATLARAELTSLDIDSRKPYGTFRPGDYVMLEGKVRGEIAPDEPIPGLDKAPRNARGKVEYAARIVLIVPAKPANGNGTLLVDIPNRGKAYAHALYNSPRDAPFQSGTFEQGTGYLEEQGYSVAEVYWELGMGADLPSFTEGGKTQYIEGVGFAIVRDTADFLAHESADRAGHANPIAGSIRRTLASGKSQAGRVLKSFVLAGYNRAGGRRVFDGLHIFVSASGYLPILRTSPGPESSANGFPTFEAPDIDGVDVSPFTPGELVAAIAARHEVPPKIIFVNSTTDFYSRHASLSRTGVPGTTEQAIPPNVRVYEMASAPHDLGVRGRKGCDLPTGQLDWTPVARATLMRLNVWVADGQLPPPNRVMPLEVASGDPPALRAPASLKGAVIEVPQRDADGNAVGGVRLPDVAAPLGTHAPQNKPNSRGCMLVGAFIPFAATKAEREANGDARLSIAERYRDRDDYVNRVRVAARELGRQGFLLADDAAVIVQAAASSKAFAPKPQGPSKELGQ